MKQLAFNPYLPSWEYVPDGEPHVFGDRLYVYGSHDKFNGEDFCLNDYVCWSAPVEDLSDWKFEGTIYRRSQDKYGDKMYLYAPDVCQGPDGRYYLYYCMNRDSTVGVAVCDTPAGQFEYYGRVHYPDGTEYGKKKGDNMTFDPGVFRDDDDRIYLYTGFGLNGFIGKLMGMRAKVNGGYAVELSSDMLTICSAVVSTVTNADRAKGTPFDGHALFEASSMRKINGKYYFIYSSVLSHELCYATSDSPMGPFTYGGTIVSNGDVGYQGRTRENALNYMGNTHGSLVEVKGQWYVFHHRQTNQHAFSRQGLAEKVTINEDGSISQVESTSCGLNDGPLPGTGTYEARIACNLSSVEGTYFYARKVKGVNPQAHPYFTQSGEDREGDGDQYIANMQDGSWAGFKYFRFDQEKKFTLRYRGSGSGKVVVSTIPKRFVKDATAEGADEMRKKSFNSMMCQACLEIAPSADWTEVSAAFSPVPEEEALYLCFLGTGAIDIISFTME